MTFRMDDMELNDSISLLMKAAGMDVADENYPEAEELAGKLNRLPLAVVHAGTAIRQNESTIRAYLQEYERNKDQILTSHPEQGADSYGLSVFATWRTSLKMMEAQNGEVMKTVRHILNVCNHYHHEDIPKSLLYNTPASASSVGTGIFQTGLGLLRSAPLSSVFFSSHSPSTLDHSTNEKAVDDAIFKLSSYSLVRLQSGNVSMHALVQSWARYESASDRGSAQRWGRQAALAALEKEIDTGDTVEQHEKRRRIYPHVRCFLEPGPGTVDVEITAAVSAKFALTAFDAGNFSMAELLYKKSLHSAKARFWFTWKTSEVSDLLDGLVSAQERQGHYVEAVKNAEELVSARTRRLGCNHLRTLQANVKLALAHQGTSNYPAAHEINHGLLKKLCSCEFTEQHEVFSAEVIKNHADVLFREGNYADSAVLLRVALDLRARIIGETHPETLETMASLADVLAKQDEWEEASRFASLAYRKRQKMLGNTHPDTLSSLRALGNVHYHRRQYSACVEAQERVLEARKRTLGCQHPETTSALNELAKAQLAIGAYKTAEANFRTALRGFEEQLGSQHHFLLITKLNLAVCLRHQDNPKQAEELYVEVLAEFDRRGDADHPDALACKSNLAVLLYDEGRFSDAEDLQREVLTVQESLPGVANVAISRSLQSLAYTISKCPGRYQEADDMMKRAIEGFETTLDPESHEFLDSLCQRANLLRRLKDYEHSHVLFTQACSTFKRMGVQDHWCFQRLLALENSMSKKGLEVPMRTVDTESASSGIGESSQKRKLEPGQATESEDITDMPTKKQKRVQENLIPTRWQTTIQEVLGIGVKVDS